jgi:sulfur carrier protein
LFIKVNGQEEEIYEGVSIKEFIISKGFKPDNVVVELNREIIKSDVWDDVTLKENDVLEVLRFVGGG